MSTPANRLTKIMDEIGREGLSVSALDNVRQEAEAFASMIHEVQSGEFSGIDGSGGVTAEVDGHGKVLSIKVTAKGMRDLDHKALGPAVVQAINDARRQAGEEIVQALHDRLGIEVPDELPAVPDMEEITRLLARRHPTG